MKVPLTRIYSQSILCNETTNQAHMTAIDHGLNIIFITNNQYYFVFYFPSSYALPIPNVLSLTI